MYADDIGLMAPTGTPMQMSAKPTIWVLLTFSNLNKDDKRHT